MTGDCAQVWLSHLGPAVCQPPAVAGGPAVWPPPHQVCRSFFRQLLPYGTRKTMYRRLSLILSPLCPGSVCQAASPRGHWSPTPAAATPGSGEATSSKHRLTLTRIPQVLGRGSLGSVHRVRVPRRAHPEGGPPGRGQGLQGRDHHPAENSPPGAQI